MGMLKSLGTLGGTVVGTYYGGAPGGAAGGYAGGKLGGALDQRQPEFHRPRFGPGAEAFLGERDEAFKNMEVLHAMLDAEISGEGAGTALAQIRARDAEEKFVTRAAGQQGALTGAQASRGNRQLLNSLVAAQGQVGGRLQQEALRSQQAAMQQKQGLSSVQGKLSQSMLTGIRDASLQQELAEMKAAGKLNAARIGQPSDEERLLLGALGDLNEEATQPGSEIGGGAGTLGGATQGSGLGAGITGIGGASG